MRVMINGLSHLTVIHIRLCIELLIVCFLTRPEGEEILGYIRNCRKALLSSPLKCLTEKTGRIRYRNHALHADIHDVQILKDRRIRKLQGKAARIILLRQYGISPIRREIRILGQYSSLSWLCRNLERAAGIKTGGQWDEEDLHRIRTVFPAFCEGLGMELMGQSLPGIASYRLYKSRKLYPDKLRRERLKRIREMKKDRMEHHIHLNRIYAEEIRFTAYLQLQGVILSGKKHSIRRIRILYSLLHLTGSGSNLLF